MTKIQYMANGQIIEIEVSDSYAQVHTEMLDQDKKAFEREKWRCRKKITNLHALAEQGVEIADKTIDVEEEAIMKDYIKRGLATLTKEQRELVCLVYFQGYSLADISRMQGRSKPAVTQQMQRALAQLKKYFEIF